VRSHSKKKVLCICLYLIILPLLLFENFSPVKNRIRLQWLMFVIPHIRGYFTGKIFTPRGVFSGSSLSGDSDQHHT